MTKLQWDHDSIDGLLGQTRELAADFLKTLPHRPVGPRCTPEELRSAIPRDVPSGGEDPRQVIGRLAASADPGLMASAGPRFFGYVIGGSLPVALAADWLTAAWDQNCGLYSATPATSVIEEATAAMLLELFGLPSSCSVGFVTGGQMANFTALAAARHRVLLDGGWNVEEEGLGGAPPVTVICGAEAHATILTSLRMLGFGTRDVRLVACDEQGRMRPGELEKVIAGAGAPLIVCSQVGNVNSGAIDPIADIAGITRPKNAWLHVDGAFGLWARVSAERAGMLAGIELASSWATDAHKWLNVPYDSGVAICADRAAHSGAMSARADYLIQSSTERDPIDWTPELSRRARSVPIYAAIRALGRSGIASLVDRTCDLAARFARLLSQEPGVEILNDVVLNQVLVRFRGADDAANDEITRNVVQRVQQEGTCWLSGTVWQGMHAMRISVCNWSTTEEDVDVSAAAVVRCYRDVIGGRRG